MPCDVHTGQVIEHKGKMETEQVCESAVDELIQIWLDLHDCQHAITQINQHPHDVSPSAQSGSSFEKSPSSGQVANCGGRY